MRVLIATADSAFAQAARLALRNDALTTESAASTEDVLIRTAALPYDALVLDLALPAAESGELIRQLRRQPHTPPILAITPSHDPALRIAVLRSGADDCIAAPPLMEELAARVHALARRAGRQSGECLEIDDLVLHAGKRRAFRAGQPLTLTPREFTALEYLVRQRGRPVPGEELLGMLGKATEPPRKISSPC